MGFLEPTFMKVIDNYVVDCMALSIKEKKRF